MKAECPICRTPIKLSQKRMKLIDKNLEDAKDEWKRDDAHEILNLVLEEAFGEHYEFIIGNPLCDECFCMELVQNAQDYM